MFHRILPYPVPPVQSIVIAVRELNSEAQRFVKNPMQAALLGAFDSSIVCEVDY